MQCWLILILCFFPPIGHCLGELDLFNIDDETLPQYDGTGTQATNAPLSWGLDDISFASEEPLLTAAAQEGDDVDAAPGDISNCDLDTLEPVGKLRPRGPVCTDSPPKKKFIFPLWDYLEPQTKTTSFGFGEFTCYARGFEYIVCDSGDSNDRDQISPASVTLLNCDLCTFRGYLFPSLPRARLLDSGIELKY